MQPIPNTKLVKFMKEVQSGTAHTTAIRNHSSKFNRTFTQLTRSSPPNAIYNLLSMTPTELHLMEHGTQFLQLGIFHVANGEVGCKEKTLHPCTMFDGALTFTTPSSEWTNDASCALYFSAGPDTIKTLSNVKKWYAETTPEQRVAFIFGFTSINKNISLLLEQVLLSFEIEPVMD